MLEKMSLTQFEKIKNQLSQIIKDYEDYYEAHKNDENYDDSLLEQQTIEKYLKIQNVLVNYDLSDIPFEAWDGMALLADEFHQVDFSKTKANIDFSLVDYGGYVNFKGCNVRNLEKIKTVLSEKSFDEETIKANNSLFLMGEFTEDFKKRFYDCSLKINDLLSLSINQLAELKQKDFFSHLDYAEKNNILFDLLGIDKMVEFYNYSKIEYDEVNKLMNSNIGFKFYTIGNRNLQEFNKFSSEVKLLEISKVRDACYSFVRQQLLYSDIPFDISNFPESFIQSNRDILLIDKNVSEEVKQRYFERNLTIKDLLDYPEVFDSLAIDYFMTHGNYISSVVLENYGVGKFQYLLKKYPDFFKHIIEANRQYEFSRLLKPKNDIDSTFINAVKDYFNEYCKNEQFIINDGTNITYNVPSWLSSMNFKFVEKLVFPEDLLKYDDLTFVIDDNQRRVLNTLNVDNIKRFEEETGFFTHKGSEWSNGLEMFDAIGYFFRSYTPNNLKQYGVDFKNGDLSYQEFLNQFASLLDLMRKNNIFTDFFDYGWLQGEFREKHPEIFMDINAPKELSDAYYKNRISPGFLFNHKDYIPFLTDKNLVNTIKADIKLSLPGMADENGAMLPVEKDFIKEYVLGYGNESLLRLISKYGDILVNINIHCFHGEFDSEETIEQIIRKAMYNKIKKGKGDYSYLSSVTDFVSEYPQLFVNFDNLKSLSDEERQRIKTAFYKRNLSFEDIRKYPELLNFLKDKDLFVAFGNRNVNVNNKGINYTNSLHKVSTEMGFSDLALLEKFGNEKFLQLCAKYGRYLDGIVVYLNKELDNYNYEIEFEDIIKMIENIIVRESYSGNIYYNEDAPDFLKERCPDLFLSNDAPRELKSYFYNYNNTYPLSFTILNKHREWLPYLEGKSLVTALLKNTNCKSELIEYFKLFGEQKGIKLGISRAETVQEMIRTHRVELMKRWYDKTGGKFIPDFVVMQNFSIEDADKFLLSGANWSNLMRIESFSKTPEARDAMLKLAYSFGAFDNDQRGFKKLLDLLTSLPRKIDAEHGYIINQIDEQINRYSQKDYFLGSGVKNAESTGQNNGFEQMIEYIKKHEFTDSISTPVLLNLFDGLRNGNTGIDLNKNIFSQIYRKNDDNSYTLAISPQSTPKLAKVVRSILENFRDLPILNADKAHQLFGGFELKYDPAFREFLLINMDKIMNNPDNVKLVASIQKRFSEIKAVNSNRALTWELAVSYVQTNKYDSVNIGNERVAEISAIAGYSQLDFNVLQQIYNYGKQRTFSSIPRIENIVEKKSGKYHYELLRLDDPLAMAIGTLTDCCQELNNCAEVCMEHSMVSEHGRVFVIKDDQNNIVAQSWVWRNKDVLCFDNIEIPDKAFARAVKDNPTLGRIGFTDEIFEIYKQAANDLIIEDERVYKELLETGKITQEQYEGLRLGKITVGLGYNDIAESLKENASVDKGVISRPLTFIEPVKLSRGLYTSDSITQYILEERDDRKEYEGETLPVHNDAFIEYNDENFSEKNLLTLSKLELVTKGDLVNIEGSIYDYHDSTKLVTEISRNYGFNPDTTRIIVNPNFAIIYDINGNKLRVGDLLFNIKIDNDEQQIDIENQVIMQIRLAFEQIANNKEIDISALNEVQRDMYAKAMGLKDEIDNERGLAYAK